MPPPVVRLRINWADPTCGAAATAPRGRSSLQSASPVGPVEEIDGVNDGDQAAAFLDLAGDLEDAADVPRGDRRRAGGDDLVHLASAESFRHLGLSQVVGPRGATADLAFFERDQLQAGNQGQEL